MKTIRRCGDDWETMIYKGQWANWRFSDVVSVNWRFIVCTEYTFKRNQK